MKIAAPTYQCHACLAIFTPSKPKIMPIIPAMGPRKNTSPRAQSSSDDIPHKRTVKIAETTRPNPPPNIPKRIFLPMLLVTVTFAFPDFLSPKYIRITARIKRNVSPITIVKRVIFPLLIILT
ncbi:hypothetical protein KKI17_00930 [Patescibacteria group bacterium]|nr:hypothetical protein [Patescibacteria group bacterium]